MPLLEAEGLVKYYGSRKVLDGVSFHVNKGEIVGLLGPNGAGKTTTFRIVVGTIKADDGRVRFAGTDITNWPMYRRARLGLGYLPQETSVFRNLTVEQNLLAILEFMPNHTARSRREVVDTLLEHFGLSHLRKSLARQLSGGEKRRLEIARCLVSNPSLIRLDEPFTGVDPRAIQDIRRLVLELRDEGISILITDHNAKETLDITTRTYVIYEGSVLVHGTPQEVVSDRRAQEVYFGRDWAREYLERCRQRSAA